MPESSMAARFASEFVGTFMLIFTIGCNILSEQSVWAGVSIASVLTVMIYALGGASGGHFNPAVSFALGLAKKEKWDVVGAYVAVQLAAGALAGVAYSCLFWQTVPLAPASGYSLMQAGCVELLYTFMLCFVVLNVAASKMHAGKNEFYGLAIGFVIVAGAYGAGNISGGCFNPAVAFGIDLSSIAKGFGTCLVYTIFELLGAGLAVYLFRFIRAEEKYDEKSAPEPCQYGLMSKVTSEFVGTYMLVLTVGLNVITESVAGAFSIAASLMCMIFALGSVSGAHFNPAVTIALVSRGKCTKPDGRRYMLAQVVGAIFAALTYSMITGKWTLGLGPAEPYTGVQAFVAELVYTFVLAFVVLSVASIEKPKAEYFGFAIGSCVTVGGFAIGAISGGSLNPAVSIGLTAAHLAGGGGIVFCLAYVIAEVLGGVLAAQVFMLTQPSEMQAAEASKGKDVDYGSTATTA